MSVTSVTRTARLAADRRRVWWQTANYLRWERTLAEAGSPSSAPDGAPSAKGEGFDGRGEPDG